MRHSSRDAQSRIHDPCFQSCTREWYVIRRKRRRFRFPRNVEEMDTSEGDDETGEKGKCGGGIRGVKTLKKDCGGDDYARRKGHIVCRVNAVNRFNAKSELI